MIPRQSSRPTLALALVLGLGLVLVLVLLLLLVVLLLVLLLVPVPVLLILPPLAPRKSDSHVSAVMGTPARRPSSWR